MSPAPTVFRIPPPETRSLRVFAFDPSLSLDIETALINQMRLDIPWEDLAPGPVGEYLEIVDVDPASGYFYPPIDLDDAYLLVQDGLAPSEGMPQFHQQMVYAVISKTIQNFENALGRRVLWSPRLVEGREEFVQRLRVYPHALRQANAYYSPRKKAILFGYFPASKRDPGHNLPGGIVFTCLSHDIIAHETTHALLDGLHPYFAEPSNVDVLALHEAFADIVALFQHFSQPQVLLHQVARTRGDLASENLLAELAHQFGEAIGKRGALRSAIGEVDKETGQWRRKHPSPNALEMATEPHERGAILVAAVFDAFLQVYRQRVLDLLRIATGGTGVLPEGAIHPDLVNRLADEAAKVSQHILTMCIRGLDYCPPVDITFGEYLRAMITAERDLVPDDRYGYRIAMVESFRRHGIYPLYVRSLSEDSLLWFTPEDDTVLSSFFTLTRLENIQKYEMYQKRRLDKRSAIFKYDQAFRNTFRTWVLEDLRAQYKEKWGSQDKIDAVLQSSLRLMLWQNPKMQGVFIDPNGVPELEVNSVRLAHRIGPGGHTISDLVVELNQRRRGYLDPEIQKKVDTGAISPPEPDFIFRGGATLLIDIETGRVRYVISKGVDSNRRLNAQREYLDAPDTSLGYTYFGDPRVNYFKGDGREQEPFALLHRDDATEEDF